MYHYSPRTGKAEVCKAKDPKNCPFAGYLHSETLQAVEMFADKENEAQAYAVKNIQKYVETDWNIYSGKPHILTSFQEVKELRVTREALSKLNLDPKIISTLKKNDFVFFPKNKDAIQYYLKDIEHSKEMFELLRNAFKDGRIGNKDRGKPYERWELMEYLDDAGNINTNQLNRMVNLVGPTGKVGYNTMDCWNDYMKLKEEDREVWTININNQQFYLFTVNYGPKRVEDAPPGYLGRELEYK